MHTETINQPAREIIGESSLIQKLFDTIAKVALPEADVLILRENGTGKELLALEIHNLSKRRAKHLYTLIWDQFQRDFLNRNCSPLRKGQSPSQMPGITHREARTSRYRHTFFG
ncbi:MAG: sigma-54 factor interaction domain-containing protein [Chloroflexi bacterium]|nr:sigma-54 factor interaction domain-containing protein [Chloroflexota bacterium]